jgi:O-antigen ligase
VLQLGKNERAIQQDFVFMAANSGEIIIRYFLFMFLSLLLTYLFRKREALLFFCLFYVIGFVLTIIIGGYSNNYSGIFRISGGLSDPNAMAFEGITSLCVSLFLLRNITKRWLRIIVVIMAIISACSILLSFSRGAMLALIFGVLFYYIKYGQIRGIIISTIFVLLFAPIILHFVPSEIKQLTEMRFSIVDAKEKGGAGRFEIWTDYLSISENYAITGMGVGNGRSALVKYSSTNETRETHNQYLLYFVEFGIIGFLLYLFFLFHLVGLLKSTNFHDSDFFLSVSILSMLIVTMFLNTDKGRTFWIVISFANYMFWRRQKNNYKIQNYDIYNYTRLWC